MSWLSFDDRYTRQRVWDDLPYDTRWLYHAIVEKCGAERRYDGRMRYSAALRCSDVPDPDRSVSELLATGLLTDLGDVLEVADILSFLPPEGQRPENLLPRKSRNQAEWRRRRCERGTHDRQCPPASCPVKLNRAAERVAGNTDGLVTGYTGSGRVGSGSNNPRTEEELEDPWASGKTAPPYGVAS